MQCTRPVRIHNQFFPCGHCISCRIAKAREWSARLIHELTYWDKAVFVTLTYDDEHLPPNNSLRKRDLQLFFKRLRKCCSTKIKYYACGEYGDNKAGKDYGHGFGRPHYHAIIFGLGQSNIDKEFIKDCWRCCVWSNFSSKKAFGTVTYDSCRYVSDYIFKKYNGEKAKELYLSKGIEIPFKISSQGLGLRYCEQERENLIANHGFTMHGSHMALPRYYVEKLGLKLENQGEQNMAKWKRYADLHGVPLEDIGDLRDRHAKQREITIERYNSLYHKGEL